jgi:hypothetical protein
MKPGTAMGPGAGRVTLVERIYQAGCAFENQLFSDFLVKIFLTKPGNPLCNPHFSESPEMGLDSQLAKAIL